MDRNIDFDHHSRVAGFTNKDEYDDCMAGIDTRGKVYKCDAPYEDMQWMDPEKIKQRNNEREARILTGIAEFISNHNRRYD